MNRLSSTLRWGTVLVMPLLLGGCILEALFAYFLGEPLAKLETSAGVRFGQINATAQIGGCTSALPAGGPISVNCSLLGPNQFAATSTFMLHDLPAGTTIGAAYGAMILQTPAGVANLQGTYTGASSGTLPITAVTGALAADNASTIAPETGMRLWIIEPPSALGAHQFELTYDEDGTAPLPLAFKLMFVEKIGSGGRTYYPPLFPCTPSFAAIPAIALPTASMFTNINLAPMATQTGCSNKNYYFGAATAAAEAVEFYNFALDHYFVTHVPAEIAILDAGIAIKGWTRTGHTFKIYTGPQPGSSEVCRFYIPPAFGDSHFYGRGTAECNATGAAHPAFVNEDPAFFHVVLPVAGVCPAGLRNVYRVFSNRPDANHRYMVDPAVRDLMVASGWLAEGDGPNLVVMCVPA